MTPAWVTITAMLIVFLGVAAELNLMRVVLTDWLRERRDSARSRPRRTGPRKTLRAATFISVAWLGSGANAQQPQPATDAKAKDAVAAPEKSPYSLTLNLDF